MSNRAERLVVSDVHLDQEDFDRVSCAIFACGTEARATHLWSKVKERVAARSLIVDFSESTESSSYQANLAEFSRHVHRTAFVESGDFEMLAAFVRDRFRTTKADTVLLDISSMRRSTYIQFLNLLRFDPSFRNKRLLLTYSEGQYLSPYPARQIQSVRTIVGTGGRTNTTASTVACFGLGFDAGAALSMAERLEPDSIWTVVAQSEPFQQATEAQVRTANSELLQAASVRLELPSLSFEAPYRELLETFSPLSRENIICVPFGPKPHVVVFALVGMQLSNVVCMEVVSKFAASFNAQPTGRFCAATVELIRPLGRIR